MEQDNIFIRKASPSVLATNTVLRNTYLLLSLNLIFSAAMAYIAMIQNASRPNIFLFLVVGLGVPILINFVPAVRNGIMGIVLTFVYTGFLGWTLGPILNAYIKNFSNGSELIMMALGSTGLLFLVLSAISMNPNRNFSSWGRFLFIGFFVILGAFFIGFFFFKVPAFYLALSIVMAIFSSIAIMYQTNMIVQGGERNYVVATVCLYASLYNIFLTILQLLGMFGGNRNN